MEHRGLLRLWYSSEGVAGIIVLHALGRGELELPPHSRPNHPHWVIPRGWHAAMVTRYGSCPHTPRRSWPPSDDRSRLSKWLAVVFSELGVDQTVHVAGSDGGFTWMMEPSEMSRGVARSKSPILARQLSMFFASEGMGWCSCSEVVLRSMKNYKAHYSLSWFRPLLRDNSPTSNIFCIEE
jgi:hypothetical protein